MHSEYIYRVGARDTDLFGQCRPSAVMDILQEAATSAASQLHLSREETIERFHAFWMLARIWYRLAAPILWEDTITVRTGPPIASSASPTRRSSPGPPEGTSARRRPCPSSTCRASSLPPPAGI